MNELNLIILKGRYSLCRLAVTDRLPDWPMSSEFYTITKTRDELSIVCETKLVPQKIRQDGNWKLLKIAAVLDLSLTGITAKFSTALADAGVNLCVIATFDTDYIMIKEETLPVAVAALAAAGFNFETTSTPS